MILSQLFWLFDDYLMIILSQLHATFYNLSSGGFCQCGGKSQREFPYSQEEIIGWLEQKSEPLPGRRKRRTLSKKRRILSGHPCREVSHLCRPSAGIEEQNFMLTWFGVKILQSSNTHHNEKKLLSEAVFCMMVKRQCLFSEVPHPARQLAIKNKSQTVTKTRQAWHEIDLVSPWSLLSCWHIQVVVKSH